jgi:uncharacterized protein (DUF2267 family)
LNEDHSVCRKRKRDILRDRGAQQYRNERAKIEYHKFIGEVQNRARLPTIGDAVKAIRATLEVLGQRLHGGQADDLAAQLPSEIGVYLKQTGESAAFDLDEFSDRVSKREDVDLQDAVYHSPAVISIDRGRHAR